MKWFVIIIPLLLIISITSGAIPIVDFTSNITLHEHYPIFVQFNDTSDSATTWNWSFGDGRWYNTTNPNLKNITYWYNVAGKYEVNLTVNNTDGSNTSSKSDYINLTSDNDLYVKSWIQFNNDTQQFYDKKGLVWTLYDTPTIGGSSHPMFLEYGNFTSTKTGLHRYSYATLNFANDDFTIETWVNITSVAKNAHVIARTNHARNNGWGLLATTSTQDGFIFFMGSSSDNQTNTFTIPFNKWTHVVIERRSGTIYVYVNGMLNATKTGMGGSFDVELNEVTLMYCGDGNVETNGYIDETRFSIGIARWDGNFTTPYAQYRGMVENYQPDINPGSTFRFKVDPTSYPVAYIYNRTGGSYNRTLQIQNVTYTDYIIGSITTDPLYTYLPTIVTNKTTYNDIQIISYDINNESGIIQFNITRPGGFSAPGNTRVSIIDWNQIYYNYSPPSNPHQSVYFTYGKLINASTELTYPIHNFISTNLTYGEWNITSDFIASNTTIVRGNVTQFTISHTQDLPNRWNLNLGSGEFNNGTNMSITYLYRNPGIYNISLFLYLWQNESINYTVEKIGYLNVTDIPLDAKFISHPDGTAAPVTVRFYDISGGTPILWNWSLGNSEVSSLQDPTAVYRTCGNYDVKLYIENTTSSDWENVSSAISISCGATADRRLNEKLIDTQALVSIGAIMIIFAIIMVFVAKMIKE